MFRPLPQTDEAETVSRARYERERRARQEAEHLLEEKSRALYLANQALNAQKLALEADIRSRTAELERARRDAETASRTKSAFLASMSHELRTPLNGIIGVADALKSLSQDPAMHRMAGIILTSGEALLELLNDILDLSKIEAEKMDLVSTPFALAPLLDRVAGLHRIKAGEKGVSVRLQIAQGLPERVLGDEHRIAQVLHNLLSNAVKFTEQGDVTLLAGVNLVGHIVLTVRDTGIGMTADQVSRVFNRFEQADQSTARRFGGTGLGMAIVKQLVALMRGEVSVESTLGKGTQIRIVLPLPVARPLAAPVGPAVAVETADLRGIRCLAADDNGINREILDALMAPLGLDLTFAEDGQQAIDLFAADPGGYDVLLLDISMPRVDGLGALNEIRRIGATAQVPLVPAIALTANAMEDQQREFRAAGFTDCVTKPFKRQALADLILRHVALRGHGSAQYPHSEANGANCT